MGTKVNLILYSFFLPVTTYFFMEFSFYWGAGKIIKKGGVLRKIKLKTSDLMEAGAGIEPT